MPPKRPIRLVVLDLDGTTLSPDHQLNPATIAAIHEATVQGVRVVLASGRLPKSILPFAHALGLDGVHLGLNGGVAFGSDGNLLHKHILNPEQLRFAYQVFADRGWEPVIFTAHDIVSQGDSEGARLLLALGEPEVLNYQPEQLDSIVDPVKVLAILDAGPTDAMIAAQVAGRLVSIRSGPRFFELMAPGVSKGAALAELLADWGIAKDETLAVGDSENDESLFDATGFAVAMGNAVPALKAKADFVTASNADDGVALALHDFVLSIR
ncbi:MAG: Cof-type HAD-IIB family hydrolase [Spirochaetales bacterium]